MSDKTIHVMIIMFNGEQRAEEALAQLPKRDPAVVSAVIMQKSPTGDTQFKDVGLTPTRGAMRGVVLGGVVGLLTGGVGLVALPVLGGIIGGKHVQRKKVEQKIPLQLQKIAASMGPDSSAIIAVLNREPEEEILNQLRVMGGESIQALIPQDATAQLDDQADEAYGQLLDALADTTGGEAKKSVPYPRIHVVLNPASGKDEPIINVINRVFYKYGIDWSMSITRKYGDATEFARQAAADGYDLVAGYGGDGTQHEIANGIIGSGTIMGVLPGGTGNGFANELGTPKTLQPAVELLCTSHNQRKIDIAQLEEGYFIQRLFTGIEPEEQTSREEKDKYGTMAYLFRDINRLSTIKDIPYHLTIDGQEIEVQGHKCYVVNSAKAGTGISISQKFAVDDGYLDVFMLSRDRKSSEAALGRFLNLDNDWANMYYWRGQEIRVDAAVEQPVWTDGEYTDRTPVDIKIIPQGLSVAVG